MNTNNFKILVEALEALPEDINEVNTGTKWEPDSLFSNLIGLVAMDILELREAFSVYGVSINFFILAVENFLDCDFKEDICNNQQGIDWNKAFGKDDVDTLTHNDIIIHLRKVLDNWIAFEDKSNEHQYPKTEK